MAKRKLKVTQIGLKKSFFHDIYYRVIKASWSKFSRPSAKILFTNKLILTTFDDVLSQSIHSNFRYAPEHLVKAKRFADILMPSEEGTFTVDFRNFHEIEN
ncbi:MAG: hypothetical protein ACPGJV_12255 [Bacteriovoracaceae bacterium]